jgi:hypothetical protein
MTAIGISQSEINMWRRCPRRWLMEYYFGLLPANRNPASTRDQGLRWHTAMEAHYGPAHLDPGFVLDVLYGMAIEQFPESERDLRTAHELSKIMAEGYLEEAAAQGWDAKLKVIEPEAEVRIPLPGWEGIVDLRAKLDQVYYNEEDGTYGFLDHKTAADFTRDELVEMDPQMRLYSLIAWLATQNTVPQLGWAPEIDTSRPLVMGGIVRTAKRVKRTAKAKPPFYSNFPFRHDPEQLAATLLSTQKVVSEIIEARRSLDAAGSLPDRLHWTQLTVTRPVPIIHDCSRMCPLSSGLCQMMDRGLGWIDAAWRSGAYVQGDPYDRYTRGGLAEIQAYLAANAPSDGTSE